ncbi:merozoite surface protein CMZ-8 [Gracilaria domingensis]|nr:merozoite surface protein CMZ-8 [Gracilaria domingensis]
MTLSLLHRKFVLSSESSLPFLSKQTQSQALSNQKMSPKNHGASGDDGRRPPSDQRGLGLSKGGAEKKSNKRREKQRSERVERAYRSITTQDQSSTPADLLWIQAIYQEAMGTLPVGAETPPAPPPILDPLRESTHLNVVTPSLPPPTPTASASSPAIPPPAGGRSLALHPTPPLLPIGRSGGPGPSSLSYPCRHCSRVFHRLQTLERHVRIVHDEGFHRHCPYCNFSSHNAQIFAVHVRVYHRHRHALAQGGMAGSASPAGGDAGASAPSCPHCYNDYSSFDSLAHHVRHVHDREDGGRHCFECTFRAANADDFRTHRAGHRRRGVCPSCRTTVPLSHYVNHVNNCRRENN